MKNRSIVLGLGILTAALPAKPAAAVTTSTSFTVRTTVVSSCQASAIPITYKARPTAPNTAAAAVTCTHPTPYSVLIRAGVASDTRAATQKKTGADTGALVPGAAEGTSTEDEKSFSPSTTPSNSVIVVISY